LILKGCGAGVSSDMEEMGEEVTFTCLRGLAGWVGTISRYGFKIAIFLLRHRT
jgi:hypothetical protein